VRDIYTHCDERLQSVKSKELTDNPSVLFIFHTEEIAFLCILYIVLPRQNMYNIDEFQHRKVIENMDSSSSGEDGTPNSIILFFSGMPWFHFRR